ncbi:hypothetical protein [Pleomorphovibrio marinus]|uniref:hypothetical protein n=1 Tax=Pleomorphovibrio marinus TaxID=2164132 RepID=UPI000E0A54A7|nr:hypothetical protein [Pleomorphovibrio marinus]
MRNLFILPLLLISLLFLGCAPNNVFHKKSRGKWVTKKSYTTTDTLVVRNYGLYNSINEVLLTPNKKPLFVNKDSLLMVFKKSIYKIDFNLIDINLSKNLIDSSLYRQQAVRIGHIDDTYIRTLADSIIGNVKLIPIIYAHNQYSFVTSFSGVGNFSSKGWYFITYLSLFVFVIKEDEIVYSRHIRYKSDQVWADSREEILAVPPLAAVKQEHWDELVRLAMEDYIKRLR